MSLPSRLRQAFSNPVAEYLKQARSYDEDREAAMLSGFYTMRTIAIASLMAAAVSIVAVPLTIAILLPLKEKIPTPIKIDTCTGAIEPMQILGNTPKNWDQVYITSEAVKYLRMREAYHPETVGKNYFELLRRSSPEEQAVLESSWVKSNPNSPARVYGQDRVDIQIVAVRPQEYGAIVIEYVRNEFLGKQAQKSTRYQSTIYYAFSNKPPEGDTELSNPFGFTVKSYQRVPVLN